jgi:hypothetical protein
MRAVLGLSCLLGMILCLAGPPAHRWVTDRQTPQQQLAAAACRASGPTVIKVIGYTLAAAGLAFALTPPRPTPPGCAATTATRPSSGFRPDTAAAW